MLPPSVTLAAAIWAFLSKARLENLAVELGEEAAEVVEQLHLPAHEPEEPVPETSSALRLRWAAPLSLLAFGLVALRRRRGKAKAQEVQELPLAEGEPEPEPAHWKRMMSNLSDMSDRPLELGNSTEVFRMHTQEILSSASQREDKPPQLSSSSSSPSRNVLQEEAEQEEKEAEAEKAELAEKAAQKEAQAEKERQEQKEKAQEAPAQAEQEQKQEIAPEAPEAAEASTPVPESESSESTAAASQPLEPTTARPEPSEPSEPSSGADFLVSVPQEEERKPLQDGRPTPTQFPAADTPRRGLNSSLIGAPADKIREIASHLTSGQPPVYSPAASSSTSPVKKSKDKPAKASKA
eukprot:s440_g16.t1